MASNIRKPQGKTKKMSPAESRNRRDALICLGQRMSNWFYNVAQMDEPPKGWQAEAKELCTEWDEIRMSVPTSKGKG